MSLDTRPREPGVPNLAWLFAIVAIFGFVAGLIAAALYIRFGGPTL